MTQIDKSAPVLQSRTSQQSSHNTGGTAWSLQSSRPRRRAPTRPKGLSPLDYLHTDDEPRTFVYADLVRRTENIADALILANISYWMSETAHGMNKGKPRTHLIEKDGRYWLPKTARQHALETGLSLQQVNRAMTRLTSSGWIEKVVWIREGVRMLHIRFQPELLELTVWTQGVLVYGNLVRMTPSTEAAITLAQICYWLGDNGEGKARCGILKKGDWWFATTHAELAQQTGLAERSVRSAIDRLACLGLIVKKAFRFNCLPTTHIRFDLDVFRQKWDESALEAFRLEQGLESQV
jgi:hypothetical protein